jgi:hypothetical protein
MDNDLTRAVDAPPGLSADIQERTHTSREKACACSKERRVRNARRD